MTVLAFKQGLLWDSKCFINLQVPGCRLYTPGKYEERRKAPLCIVGKPEVPEN